jgi:hypothetical protein
VSTKSHQLSKESRSGPSSVRAGANGTFIVPILKRVLAQPSGATGIQISVDVNEIPVPERRYVAEVVGIDRKGETVRMLFAQTGLNSEKLRSLVIVSVFPDAVRNLLKSCDGFLPTLSEFLERNGVQPAPLQTFREEPAQTVALVSNMVAITYVGREAELDFFHLAPNALRKVNEQSEVAVDPIVRVDLATSALAPLLKRLVELEPELPPEVK